MPPRPFPLPYSIGTDITSIPRFKRYFRDDDGGPPRKISSLLKLFDKVFLPSEQRVFWRRFGSWKRINEPQKKAVRWLACSWVAGRWSAKEAIMKAHASSTDRIPFDQIEIRTHGNGKPYGIIHDEPTPSKPLAYGIEKALSRHLKSRRVLLDSPEPDMADEAGAEASKILSEDGEVDLDAVYAALSSEPSSSASASSSPSSSSPEEPPQLQLQHQTSDNNDEPPLPTTTNQNPTSLAQETDPWAEEDSLENIDGQIVQLSISHDGDFAIAVAMVPNPQ